MTDDQKQAIQENPYEALDRMVEGMLTVLNSVIEPVLTNHSPTMEEAWFKALEGACGKLGFAHQILQQKIEMSNSASVAMRAGYRKGDQ